MKIKKDDADPRDLFTEHAVSMDETEVGDWVRCSAWTRPRQIVMKEQGSFVALAEPDVGRQDHYKNRKVSVDDWNNRGGWVRMPGMRALWEAAGRPVVGP